MYTTLTFDKRYKTNCTDLDKLEKHVRAEVERAMGGRHNLTSHSNRNSNSDAAGGGDGNRGDGRRLSIIAGQLSLQPLASSASALVMFICVLSFVLSFR
jgi:hypothetical protein